jgi:hypothetical protein
MATVANGLSMDHDQPNTLLRYFVRNSRNVRFHSNSCEAITRFTGATTDLFVMLQSPDLSKSNQHTVTG